jgi:hypothetical protein
MKVWECPIEDITMEAIKEELKKIKRLRHLILEE